MRINKKVIIFAVIIGIITVLGLSSYINSVENKSVEASTTNYSTVVVAKSEIPENKKITAEMVELKSVPAESVHPDAITSIDEIIDSVSKTEILKDEQILSNKVVIDAEKARLAYRVPENMRAISIPTNEVVGVAGFISAKDKIDILVTYDKADINPVSTTFTQLQNIEVVAVGNVATSTTESQNAIPTSITVLVTPAQAEVLVYALANGSLHFSLRNPVDEGKPNLDLYNSTNFATYKER